MILDSKDLLLDQESVASENQICHVKVETFDGISLQFSLFAFLTKIKLLGNFALNNWQRSVVRSFNCQRLRSIDSSICLFWHLYVQLDKMKQKHSSQKKSPQWS